MGLILPRHATDEHSRAPMPYGETLQLIAQRITEEILLHLLQLPLKPSI